MSDAQRWAERIVGLPWPAVSAGAVRTLVQGAIEEALATRRCQTCRDYVPAPSGDGRCISAVSACTSDLHDGVLWPASHGCPYWRR